MTGSSSVVTMAVKRLEGKVAIITGGAHGFGASTARLFLQHGAKVIIADVQDDYDPKALGKEFYSEESFSYIHCDVTSDSDVKNVIDFAMSKYGKLDIMFNNARIVGNTNPSILDTDSKDFKSVFEVNVYGGFLGAKHAARVMIPAKKGVILFTASVGNVTCGETLYAYTMSKHAVKGLMKNLCVELGQYGIRVNCISPGGVMTPLVQNDKKIAKKVICVPTNLKGVVPEDKDVADAAVYLSSDESKYVSGLNLVVDGGYSTTNGSFLP